VNIRREVRFPDVQARVGRVEPRCCHQAVAEVLSSFRTSGKLYSYTIRPSPPAAAAVNSSARPPRRASAGGRAVHG